jgi:hypothetical protein
MNLLHNILRVAKEVEEEIEHVLEPKAQETAITGTAATKSSVNATLVASVVSAETAVTGNTHPTITGE